MCFGFVWLTYFLWKFTHNSIYQTYENKYFIMFNLNFDCCCLLVVPDQFLLIIC